MEEIKGMPLLGDDFPKMNVVTTYGVIDLPEFFKAKRFILFSHPGTLLLFVQQSSWFFRINSTNLES